MKDEVLAHLRKARHILIEERNKGGATMEGINGVLNIVLVAIKAREDLLRQKGSSENKHNPLKWIDPDELLFEIGENYLIKDEIGNVFIATYDESMTSCGVYHGIRKQGTKMMENIEGYLYIPLGRLDIA